MLAFVLLPALFAPFHLVAANPFARKAPLRPHALTPSASHTVTAGTPVSTLVLPFQTVTLDWTFPPDTFQRVKPAGAADNEFCTTVHQPKSKLAVSGMLTGCNSDTASHRYSDHNAFYDNLPYINSKTGEYPWQLYRAPPCDYRNNTYFCNEGDVPKRG